MAPFQGDGELPSMNALLKLVAHYWHPDPVEDESFRVGEFKADYSAMSAEEIAQDDPEMVELLKRSKAVSR